MVDDFDIGPLNWVKGEIDQALKSVLENLATLQQSPEDAASLKFSQTHLYQVSGALDMVGLEGCKRFCAEIEHVASALQKGEITMSPEALKAMINAVQSLSRYLQALVDGAPDRPLQLFPAFAALQALHGEEAEESELFFPDTDVRAPRDLPTQSLPDEALGSFLAEQRTAFQKGLLNWLKSQGAEGQDIMRAALQQVQQVQKQGGQKTLWWVASVFVDILQQPEHAANASIKKLCRRIDQQLRSLYDGATRASGNLLRDLLYFIAISPAETEALQQVQAAFELHAYLPEPPRTPQDDKAESQDRELAKRMLALLRALQDAWAAYEEYKFKALLEQFSIQLRDSLVKHTFRYDSLNSMLQALQRMNMRVLAGADVVSNSAMLEVASTLALLEETFNHYVDLSDALIQRQHQQAARLQELAEGRQPTPGADLSGTPLSADLLATMGKHIHQVLETIEPLLDGYFRHPDQRDAVQQCQPLLTQVTGAFDLLDLTLPATLSRFTEATLESLQHDAVAPSTGIFEALAEALSAMDFYVSGFPRLRPEAETAMRVALEMLQAQMSPDALADDAEEDMHALVEDHVPTLEESFAAANEAAASAASEEEIAEPEPVLQPDRAHDAELLEVFLTEAEEVLASLAQQQQALRVNATDRRAMVDLRRGFHTLKGSGRTIGLVNLGEVGWAVEKLLNRVIDSRVVPSPNQLAFTESAASAFAGWADTLRQDGEVTIDPAPWLAQAAELEDECASQPGLSTAAEVIIGGTRKLSRALFDIFMGEANQHLAMLKAWADGLPEKAEIPPEASRRAAHTLASNAGTAGFKAIADLARALEHWLDVQGAEWTPQQRKLADSVVSVLADMLRKAGQFRQPRQNLGLLAALREAIEADNMPDHADADMADAQQAEHAEAPDADLPVTSDDHDLEAPSEVPELAAEEALARAEGEPEFESEPEPEAEAEAEAEEGATEDQSASGPSAVTLEAAAKVIELFKDIDFGPEPEPEPELSIESELHGIFMIEAHELVPRIGSELRAWRHAPEVNEHPEELQRALHTLKGSARMAGQMALADVVHDMEDTIVRARKQDGQALDFEHLFNDLDQIGSLLEAAEQGAVAADAPAVASGMPAERQAQYLRLRGDVLDRLINEAGEISIARSRMEREMLAFKQYSQDLTESVSRLRNQLREMEIEAESQMQSRMAHLQETSETFDPLEFDRFTRLQELTRMMAESVNDVSTIQHGLLGNMGETESALQQQARMNRELQYGLMDVRMVPFSMISERLQRIVRQTARTLGKPAELQIEGETVQIDRTVLDKIGAPLEHLLRNAVAHGLESAAERKAAAKPEAGTIRLHVKSENDEITLTVTDDGAGIPLAQVRQKAIQRGLLSADQKLSDAALLAVIFEPGFSTADNVTQIAGRGVGLDSVRSDITGLGGRIDIANQAGQGATFSIYLPVTLSVAQVVMVRAGQHVFALPAVMVEQVQKLKPDALAQARAEGQLAWAEQSYGLYYLAQLIGDNATQPQDQRYTPVILLRSGSYHIALHVDEVLGNAEVVMKPIGPQLARVPGMAGASVMGDGKIVLIINPVQLANREALAVGSVQVVNMETAPPRAPEIMVVDDSLTMRKVLSRLLEREGYRVVVAKDGMDALQLLQDSLPDLILTDIEMPRMDGFELVRNIRGDDRTAAIPLLIISSRTAEKHRSLARELGVNAYLGKPVQDDELLAQVKVLLGAQ